MAPSLRPQRLVALGSLALLLLLLLLGRSSLHNGIELDRPLTDATSYAERAKQLASGDLSLTLGTAFRMPGYPLFLAAFYKVGLGPAAARVAQILLASSYAYLAFSIARRITGRALHGVTAALVVLAFVPFYYWTTWLFAEPLSIFLVFALLLLLKSPKAYTPLGAAAAGLLVLVLTYLKPNHLLFAPLLALWYFATSPTRAIGFKRGAVALAVVVGLLAPWSVAASWNKERPVLLTTAQGIDLWIGVGGYGTEAKDSLFGKAVTRSGLFHRDEMVRVEREAFAQPDYSARSHVFQAAALARAERAPGQALAICVSKSLHLLGFSLRNAIDFLYLAFTLAAAVSAYLQRNLPQRRPWLVAWLFVTLTALVQAFLFLPNYRFRVVLCDPLAALLIGMTLGDLVSRYLPRLARAIAPQAEG